MSRLPAAAVFIVRAWCEDGRFRARVIRSADLHEGTSTEFVTADPDELVGQLATWLREVGPLPNVADR